MLRNPFVDLEFIESLEDSLLVKFTYLLQNIYCRESHLMQYHQLQDIIASQKKKKKRDTKKAEQRKKKRNGKNRRRRNDVSRGSVDVATRGYTSSVHHGGFLPFVRPIASIMQRRPPPQEGKRLAPAGCARGGSYNGKAASPLHTGNTHHGRGKEQAGEEEEGRGGEGRRREKKKEEEKGETGPSAKGVHREPYRSSPEHYSVYRSSLVKSCQKMSLRGGQGVGERWKS